MIYSVLLYSLCLVLSAIGAWTDLHAGNMRNTHLIIGAAVGIAISAVSLLRGAPAWDSLQNWGINFCLSIIVSIVFYLSDVWAPGDAKLYILIAALYPQRYYAARPGNIFPALSIVVFAYAAGYIYLICEAIFRHKARLQVRQFLHFDRVSIFSMLASLGFFIGFQMLLHTLFPSFAGANYALVLLVTIGISYLASQKAPRLAQGLGVLGLLVAVCCSIVTKQYTAILSSIPLGIVVALITRLLLGIAGSNSYREIPGAELKPGMILSFGSIMAMQKCIDPNIPHSTTENRRSRISSLQAEAVRNWCRITGSPISIVEMLPFLPFVFVAVFIEPIRLYMFS